MLQLQFLWFHFLVQNKGQQEAMLVIEVVSFVIL